MIIHAQSNVVIYLVFVSGRGTSTLSCKCNPYCGDMLAQKTCMPCRYFEKKMACILNFWDFSVNADHFYKFVNKLVYLPIVAEDYEMLFVRLSKELVLKGFL